MISENIIKAKTVLKRIEQLNSNPEINGKKAIYDALIELDIIVQQMLIVSADYAN